MTCGHCGSVFNGPFSQYKHVRYDGTKAYCSKICRSAGTPKPPMRGKPRPMLSATCEQCRKPFQSKTSKFFCSLRCYVASPRFKARVRENYAKGSATSARLARQKGREVRECVHCKETFEVIKSSRKKFCARLCMRYWLAARFDRWIASPQKIALPQNYDEFLSSTQIACLVEDCGWIGDHLTIHMNQAHGVPASDFKRAAGFNLGSGIISAPLQSVLSARANVGIIIAPIPSSPTIQSGPIGYQSLEGREHRAKTRAMIIGTVPGPVRQCVGCQSVFQQSTPFGRAKYCSIACRKKHAKY